MNPIEAMAPPRTEEPIDAERLASELRDRVKGEVRFEDGDRTLWATDASNYRQTPIGVVLPRDAEDVVATVAACRRHGAPVLPRGGGTSLAGQCCNTAVVIDTTKYMTRVLEVDPERRTARVQAGTVLDDLRAATAPFGLTFGPDPATHTHCVLGGMIGNNSCGVHSVLAHLHGPGPRVSDNIEELEILTYDGVRMRVGRTDDDELERIIRGGGRRGEIYAKLRALRDRYADRIRERFPDIPRRVSGYNLDDLLPENDFHVARALAGTEGTCATILEATVRLVHAPPKRTLVVLGYPDVHTAADHVPDVMAFDPVGLEGMDDRLVGYMRKKGLHPEEAEMLPDGGGWLLVEFGGETQDEADERARRAAEEARRAAEPTSVAIFEDPDRQEKIWQIRESGLGATAFVPDMDDTWPGWEDSAVPPDRLGDYLRDLRRLLDEYGYECAFYGHFGEGCLHSRIDFDLTSEDGIRTYRRFADEAADLVVRYGGSLSGEHGDGQARAELLPKMFGDDLVRAFREFKAVWDPDGKMNPGKVVDPAGIDENLRLGAGYVEPDPPTHFQYPDDRGRLGRATLRCVGVGKCRRLDGGTMCPSYMVLREEKHTTRGRAHLLFEMLRGEVDLDGWQSEYTKESLDLCLSCKGCKGDCPVNVDIATYKAEFLSRYYEHNRRPRTAYSMGLIHRWARLASAVPGLVNLTTQTPGLRSVAKAVAGLAPQRSIPPFAPRTFRSWFAGHRPANPDGRRVLLWPDTFNNFFHPGTAQAAVEVLEAAGYDVAIPPHPVCCGRPLYEYGMLDTAERLLRKTMDVLGPELRAGTPIIGLEPSCTAVFRDELINLFPDDEEARRLHERTFTLGEFLARDEDYRPPTLRRRALVHGHCHHKAIMTIDAEKELLGRMGIDLEVLDAGCCGMAGSFGFEPEKYDVSVAAGERVLLPAVRDADDETIILTDGFSCREQIAQHTDRRALHLADVLQLALRGREAAEDSDRPEAAYIRRERAARSRRRTGVLGAAALGAGIGLAGELLRRRV